MKNINNAIFAVAAVLTFAAFAEEAYVPSSIAWLIGKDDASKGMSPQGLPGAGCWQIDGASAPLAVGVVAGQDYGYSDNRYQGADTYKLRIPQSVETFEGNSLSVGDAANSGQLILRCGDSGVVDELTFANQGLFFNNGSLHCNSSGSQNLHGKITVNSAVESPFGIYFIKNGSGLKITGTVSAGSENGLYVHSLPSAAWPGDSTQKDFVCRFAEGSLSSFCGSLICGPVAWEDRETKANYFKTTSYRKPPYSATISSDTCEMPGSIRLYPGGNLAAESASTVFSVANLETVYEWGTNVLVVAVSADAKKCSLVKVTGSLALAAPLRIRLAGLENFSVDAATNSVSKLAVFKAPANVALDESDFLLEHAELDPYLPRLPDYRIEVADDEDGLSTVWIVRERPVVWSINSDNGQWKSMFTKADNWSDGAIPSDTRDYLVSSGHTIRTPETTATDPQVFEGNSLSMQSNAVFSACARVTRIDDLRTFGYCRLNGLNQGDSTASANIIEGPLLSWKLQGRIKVDSDETNEKDALHIQCYQSRMWIIESEISGRGRIYVDFTSRSNDSNPKRIWTVLSGLNTNFYGTISVKNSSANFANRLGTHLLIYDARNLGGPLEKWTYNALDLGDCSALHPLSSMTLDDASRGIFVSSGRAFFTVTNDVVFTCKERITYNGILIKDGPGELALGGPAPYFDADGDTGPTAGKNVLDVLEGVLRPLSANAFAGVNLTITNGATLAFNVPASNDDGDIGQYGIRNSGVNTPMTVPSSGITVAIEDPDGLLASKVRARVPICTVKESAKNNLNGKIFVGKSPSPSFAASGEWSKNSDGTWTFAAVLRRGLVISIR